MSVCHSHVEHVMGMPVSFDIRDADLSPADLDDVVRTCVEWLYRVDEIFSTYRPHSEVCRVDRGELQFGDCSAELCEVLEQCEHLRVLTHGYFDVRACGHLDPSGYVKGWAIERASGILARAGATRHCVNAGGDVAVAGGAGPEQPWRVGIAHPSVDDALCAVVPIFDGAVATSGTATRGYHVVDPHRAEPATALASVTVVGPHLGLADAYATAALAMGVDAPAWLETVAEHECFVVDGHGRCWSTELFGADP